MRFGVMCLKRGKAAEASRELYEWMCERRIDAVPLYQDTCFGDPNEQARWLTQPASSHSEVLSSLDMLVVLGGDGSLLAAARLAASFGVPILGVNLGHLGFLSAVEGENALDAIIAVQRGEYYVEQRMMLEALVERGGEVVGKFTGLNDAVLNKSGFSRMLTIDISVGSEYVQTVPADGVIVCTPTGSTAYSLSAGGPIVNPLFECLVVTPICPHTLYSRSQVISGDEEVRISVTTSGQDTVLTVDGQVGHRLSSDDQVRVRRSPWSARFVRFPGHSFYRILREKLRERPRYQPDSDGDDP
ncbi:MAG: NAD(+)/NADH kinase [Bacillota bacterium]|nr:NAD(+)/NADH kinase [Bacillota bacterium]HOB91242.1 NAD(+)/NADH kinase [Bacillota bacterium]HPZ53647.1 NAD(+)/NADH kinase [Bacillota bacterium]HQD17208.1 NAD(+)/NADH kinase [Bacillota bacterium]